MKAVTLIAGAGALVLAGFVGAHFAGAQMSGMGSGMGHDAMHKMMHGAGGMGHDEANMPGLRGVNATPEESAELATMFQGYESFSRTVDVLPNGIRTVTHSSDPQVMEALVSHVTGMIGRVEAKDDPQIFIQSPTLDIFFERSEALDTTIDVTDAGIVVVQTSDDPELVAALHKHAAEVSDMAERGMEAVHEAMMTRMGG